MKGKEFGREGLMYIDISGVAIQFACSSHDSDFVGL